MVIIQAFTPYTKIIREIMFTYSYSHILHTIHKKIIREMIFTYSYGHIIVYVSEEEKEVKVW